MPKKENTTRLAAAACVLAIAYIAARSAGALDLSFAHPLSLPTGSAKGQLVALCVPAFWGCVAVTTVLWYAIFTEKRLDGKWSLAALANLVYAAGLYGAVNLTSADPHWSRANLATGLLIAAAFPFTWVVCIAILELFRHGMPAGDTSEA